MIGLCDCNSFYATCEKLFRPDLKNKPVVVLSNNDGCIVALSKEAKALGIKRGAPYYSQKDVLEKNNVTTFSSNYTLYQDISDRVMEVLKSLVGTIMPYSIDEAFFMMPKNIDPAELRRKIVQYTGIEVSIGIARTKTLAKVANHIGKKEKSGAYVLTEEDEERMLKKVPVQDIWGIGYKRAVLLNQYGINNAYQLIQKNDIWIKKQLTIMGYATVSELRGIPMVNIDNPPLKSTCSGITFSHVRSNYEELEEAIACHCTNVANKLIENNMNCQMLSINLFTNRFLQDYIAPCAVIKLDEPTNYIPLLIKAGKSILKKIYTDANYKGCRVWATELSPSSSRQLDLFMSDIEIDKMTKQDKLSKIVNDITKIYGRKSLNVAAANKKVKNDLMSRKMLSPCYTTKWKDLPIVFV
ncbi:MAG: Y-family DNA polymerase [Sphaerochaetaceae bacterium]|nr:Y-family DNA polymerase [Sphaerochaetaceae bacterium]